LEGQLELVQMAAAVLELQPVRGTLSCQQEEVHPCT